MATDNIQSLNRAASPLQVNDKINEAIDALTWTNKNAACVRVSNTAYAEGDVVNCPYDSGLEMVCTTAGTTADGVLAEASCVVGTITDGTVVWTIRSKVKKINGSVPDVNGNITVDVGVKKINGVSPDAEGNCELEIVTTRNIGDVFYTMRTDDSLNGAVECDGT